MKTLHLKSYAKINLTLEITDRRADGYHSLATVMQSVSLADQLMVALEAEPGIRITCSNPNIPTNENNTAWQAAARFFEAAGLSPACSVVIDKKIPAAAGLGGGSSNAAGVLTALNTLYNNLLSPQKMHSIAAAIGADVPFCLTGGTQMCTGIGDILEPLRPLAGWPVLLVTAPFAVSTPEIYQSYDQLSAAQLPPAPDHAEFLPAVDNVDWPALARSSANMLEAVVFPRHPQLAATREYLAVNGALLARMSGSGPTLFAVYENNAALKAAIAALQTQLPADFGLLPVQMLDTGLLADY